MSNSVTQMVFVAVRCHSPIIEHDIGNAYILSDYTKTNYVILMFMATTSKYKSLM